VDVYLYAYVRLKSIILKTRERVCTLIYLQQFQLQTINKEFPHFVIMPCFFIMPAYLLFKSCSTLCFELLRSSLRVRDEVSQPNNNYVIIIEL
jgi:hypothetical protein